MFTLEQLKKCPDAFGELLRRKFFTDDGFGCYENYSLRPDIVQDCDRQVYWGEDAGDFDEWTVAYWESPMGKVEMSYYWDGDGTLQFLLPDGSTLCNDDCKKSHGWFLDNEPGSLYDL